MRKNTRFSAARAKNTAFWPMLGPKLGTEATAARVKNTVFLRCLARSWAPRLQNASVALILNRNSLSQALLGVPRRSRALPSAHRRTQRGPRRNPKPRAHAFRRSSFSGELWAQFLSLISCCKSARFGPFRAQVAQGVLPDLWPFRAQVAQVQVALI